VLGAFAGLGTPTGGGVAGAVCCAIAGRGAVLNKRQAMATPDCNRRKVDFVPVNPGFPSGNDDGALGRVPLRSNKRCIRPSPLVQCAFYSDAADRAFDSEITESASIDRRSVAAKEILEIEKRMALRTPKR
jgi:hypothetical protein